MYKGGIGAVVDTQLIEVQLVDAPNPVFGSPDARKTLWRKQKCNSTGGVGHIQCANPTLIWIGCFAQ